MSTQLEERPVTNGQPLPDERKWTPTPEPPPARGDGWLVFAGTALGLVGILNVIDGIVALSQSRFFTANAVYTFGDLRTWGWIVLAVGVVQILAAGGVLARAQWARCTGMIMAGLGALAQFAFMQSYPFWSLTIFAVCVLALYGLAMYGGSPQRARSN